MQHAINTKSYVKWLGFAFERWCRRYHYVIAKLLGFSAVRYSSGVYCSRSTNKENPGFQIDLVFSRDDNVYTICEIKYLQHQVTTKVIEEFEKKLMLFPNKKNKTIHKILICNEGAAPALIDRGYFDNIVTAEQLFMPNSWN